MWNVILFGTVAGLLGAFTGAGNPLTCLAVGAACGTAFVLVELWLHVN